MWIFSCDFQGELNTLHSIQSGNGTIVRINDTLQSFDDVIFGVAFLNGTCIGSGIKWQDRCRYTKGLGRKLAITSKMDHIFNIPTFLMKLE
jgi:hypothetical protein